MGTWNKGHTIALLLAASSMGISRVTETKDALVVEYGDPRPPKTARERCQERPHKRWPVRR